MRAFGFLLFFLLSCFPVMAAVQLTTQVHDVDVGSGPQDEILVFLKSGHVAKLPKGNKGLLDEMILQKEKASWFVFTLDEERFIQSAEPVTPPVDIPSFHEEFSGILKSTYVPTTVASMEVAQRYHREGRRNPKDSQCFNRAMVWTYEWWKRHSLKSMKILIFFTRNYIRRYNFEWWFHIAPYIHVMEDGKVVERVMDLKYTSRPTSFKKWTDIFMRNDPDCPVITKYSQYADYPYTGECYLMRTNMYTYQPADLQMHEAWGYTKTRFVMDEVKGAYLEAFDMKL